jgi:carboxypeptidase Taq
VRADEVAYNLHIILRFELELDLLEGKVTVADLPKVWNERFEQMFGVRPPSDSEGVLQDIHWSMGAFGYFPTYTLGNLISAQLWESVLEEFPQLPQQIAQGDYAELLSWLRKHVHEQGSRVPTKELVKNITGKEISSAAFVRQMKRKYGELYGLKD